MLQNYTVCGWLNTWMWNHGYVDLTVKLYVDFQLCRGSTPLTPAWFKGPVGSGGEYALLVVSNLKQ